VYSALYRIPVVVENWNAAWEEGAVVLGWRLDGTVVDESSSLRLQRSEEAAGPYEPIKTPHHAIDVLNAMTALPRRQSAS
jgi:hypothetical protein